jgi:hypothetical protein
MKKGAETQRYSYTDTMIQLLFIVEQPEESLPLEQQGRNTSVVLNARKSAKRRVRTNKSGR